MKTFGFLLFGIMLVLPARFGRGQQHFFLYTGSYTSSDKEGINVYDFDPSKPSLRFLFTVSGIQDPSYLIIHPSGRFLYTVNELMTFEGKSSGAVSSYAIDPGTGKLTFLNAQPTGGTAPCHLTFDPSGKWLFTANYGGGNIAVFPLHKDGRIGEVSDFIQHHGHGPDKERQKGPHAHQVVFDKNTGILYVADLGLDKVFRYSFDPTAGKLTPDSRPWIKTPPGSGPRHLTIGKGGNQVYILAEMSSAIIVAAVPKNGNPSVIQEISMLPDGFSGSNTGAEITFSPDGKYLFASNRGNNSLVQYKVDPATGRLSVLSHYPSGGKNPRYFCFDPTGNFVFSANQTTGNILLYRYDNNTGKLRATGIDVKLPEPVCIAFLRKRFIPE